MATSFAEVHRSIRSIIFVQVKDIFNKYRAQYHPQIRARVNKKDIQERCDSVLRKFASQNKKIELTIQKHLDEIIFHTTRSLLRYKNIPTDDPKLRQLMTLPYAGPQPDPEPGGCAGIIHFLLPGNAWDILGVALELIGLLGIAGAGAGATVATASTIEPVTFRPVIQADINLLPIAVLFFAFFALAWFTTISLKVGCLVQFLVLPFTTILLLVGLYAGGFSLLETHLPSFDQQNNQQITTLVIAIGLGAILTIIFSRFMAEAVGFLRINPWRAITMLLMAILVSCLLYIISTFLDMSFVRDYISAYNRFNVLHTVLLIGWIIFVLGVGGTIVTVIFNRGRFLLTLRDVYTFASGIALVGLVIAFITN